MSQNKKNVKKTLIIVLSVLAAVLLVMYLLTLALPRLFNAINGDNTEEGTANGKFLGLVTDKDYRITRVDLDEPIDNYMLPKDKLVWARKGISLSEANDMIWEHKISCLPILDENDNLDTLVFLKFVKPTCSIISNIFFFISFFLFPFNNSTNSIF